MEASFGMFNFIQDGLLGACIAAFYNNGQLKKPKVYLEKILAVNRIGVIGKRVADCHQIYQDDMNLVGVCDYH